MSERTVRLGLLGCGTVGAALARLLTDHAEDISARAGAKVEIAAIAVRDLTKERDVPLDASLFTDDPQQVLDDPGIDIVVELMGGREPARSLILGAFERGKPVVTANKEVLANFGPELFDAADQKSLDLEFEAAVGGGIALIRPLKESLAGDRLTRITGIVNGTTNFILTRMADDGLSFEDALAEAQRLGFAEADPTADVEGFDAASKLAILASIAFNAPVIADDVSREGITSVSADDIRYAERLGYAVKLLAVAELEDGQVSARVHPAMIPTTHPLASVRGSLNAVYVEGDLVGEQMFYGRGAGGDPTAVAVAGDVIAVARGLASGTRGMGVRWYREHAIRPAGESHGEYYLRMDVEDRPGVLAAIATVFGDQGVSIKSVVQEGAGDDAQLVFVTHEASEGDLRRTVEALGSLPVVHAVQGVLRVEAEVG